MCNHCNLKVRGQGFKKEWGGERNWRKDEENKNDVNTVFIYENFKNKI